jgi:transcriptional regulator with XRE-family HTH domain
MMVGEKIRKIRLNKGYSQEYMAFMLDINQSTFSKIEQGNLEITVRRLYSIAEILEVNVIELLPDANRSEMIELSAVTRLFLKAKLLLFNLLYKFKANSK